MQKSTIQRLAVGTLALSLALGTATTVSLAQGAIKRGGIFRVIRDGTAPGLNLNPFSPSSKRLNPTISAIYESLFYTNTLNGNTTPVLGTKYAWSKDSLGLTVTTRGGVKWTDGQPFMASDVAFTFNYLKANPAIDTTGVWDNGLSKVAATGPNTVVFTFSRVNTPLQATLFDQVIVPEHLWKAVKDPVTFTNPQAVATGPFLFKSAGVQSINVVRNPNYWMAGRPYIDGITWKFVGGNDAALLSLLKNDADFGYIGVTDIKEQYADRNPATNLYFWPVNNTNILYLNTTKAPFNSASFRKALAMAIDVQDVAKKAYAGSAGAADPTGIIPTQRPQWVTAAVKAQGYKYDVEAAKAMLDKAGYKADASGKRLGLDGKPLPAFKILVGAGWTDFITMAQVISEDLKALGLDTVIDQQAWATYSGGLQTATYDMGISWGWGNRETPYDLFYRSFDPKFSAAVGKTADSNLTRYTNPEVTAALATYRSSSDRAVQQKAISTILTNVLRDVPFIPLTDRTNFGIFNATKFTGFPSAQNLYNDSTPDDQTGARLLYLNVHLK